MATLAPSAIIEKPKSKIVYIDWLKVILIALVVLHHSFVTYGASGGWYYQQKSMLTAALAPMTMFVSVNQSFFMGMFFFLSSYFIGPSYDKKGPAKFVTDRLLRLGLPLVFYSFILGPFMNYLVYYFGKGHHITLMQFLSGYDDWIDFGVLWFVAALLLFTLIYVLVRVLFKNLSLKTLPAPTAGTIMLFATGVGVMSFLVRLVFPVGWSLKPLGFQLGHFSQYISLFVFGLIASKNNWLNTVSDKTGKRLGRYALRLLAFFAVFFIIQETTHMDGSWWRGGWHWQALLYAVWEQVIGFCIIVGLLNRGRRLWNEQSARVSKLSRLTFAVYIFHPLVLISLSLLVSAWAIEPALKLLFVAPLAVIGSFLLASVIVQIPGVKKII
ncbi:MAG: acyltransferase family protein [Sphingobacteriales bacterium]